MAQQMRIRDQEIIVKKIVKVLKEKGLEDLETRFGGDSDIRFLDGEVKKLIALKEKLKELTDKKDTLEKSINRGVEDFNKANDLCAQSRNNGLQATLGYGYSKEDERKVYFAFNLEWHKQTEIADELAMQTIGTDFNVKDLIANLIAEFS